MSAGQRVSGRTRSYLCSANQGSRRLCARCRLLCVPTLPFWEGKSDSLVLSRGLWHTSPLRHSRRYGALSFPEPHADFWCLRTASSRLAGTTSAARSPTISSSLPGSSIRLAASSSQTIGTVSHPRMSPSAASWLPPHLRTGSRDQLLHAIYLLACYLFIQVGSSRGMAVSTSSTDVGFWPCKVTIIALNFKEPQGSRKPTEQVAAKAF